MRSPWPKPATWPPTLVGASPEPARGRRPRQRRWLAELERSAEALEAIAAQTRVRLAGEVPDGSTRVVSLHDTDARPIAKGRLGKPVEFGYKAQVVDNADGIVVDHHVVKGNPPDAPMLVPAMARHRSPLRKGAPGRHRRSRLRRGRR